MKNKSQGTSNTSMKGLTLKELERLTDKVRAEAGDVTDEIVITKRVANLLSIKYGEAQGKVTNKK